MADQKIPENVRVRKKRRKGGGASVSRSSSHAAPLVPDWVEGDPAQQAYYDRSQASSDAMVQNDVDEAKARLGVPRDTPHQVSSLKGFTIKFAVAAASITILGIDMGDAAPRYQPSLLLDMLVPLERAQDMHANLEELFPVWVARHGAQRAVWIQRVQVFLLIGGQWWEKILLSAERVLKVVRLVGS